MVPRLWALRAPRARASGHHWVQVLLILVPKPHWSAGSTSINPIQPWASQVGNGLRAFLCILLAWAVWPAGDQRPYLPPRVRGHRDALIAKTYPAPTPAEAQGGDWHGRPPGHLYPRIWSSRDEVFPPVAEGLGHTELRRETPFPHEQQEALRRAATSPSHAANEAARPG